MTKFQIAVLGILGLVACVVVVGVGAAYFYLFLPSQQQSVAIQPPEPTATPALTSTPSPTPTATPLPTNTPEPTPISTSVVAATPSPTPGESLTDQMTGLTGQVNQEQASEQTPAETGVRFWADNSSLQAGECTNLHWQAEGVSAYWIDGQPGAGPTGELHICPTGNETHILKYDESVDGLLRSKEIQVSISVHGTSGGDSGSSSGGGSSDSGSSGSGSVQVAASGLYIDPDDGVAIDVGNGQVAWSLGRGQCVFKSNTEIKDTYVEKAEEQYTIWMTLDNPDEIVGQVTWNPPFDFVCADIGAFVARNSR